MDDSLYIVIPAYNEQENIGKVVADWYPIVQNIGSNSKLLIIDDGSRDNTYEVLKNLSVTHTFLCPIKKENEGHGPTLLYGYKYALDMGANYIFQTDSDGQTNPNEFQKFWNMRSQYDAILGVRRNRGDGKFRAFVEKTVCLLLKIYFGIDVPDANAPFRLMRRDIIEKYINRLPDKYNLPNIMLTAYFSYYNEKITFENISFKPRTYGTNSINWMKIVKIGWNALGDFKKLKSKM